MDVLPLRFCSCIDLKLEKRPGRAGKHRCVPVIRQIISHPSEASCGVDIQNHLDITKGC